MAASTSSTWALREPGFTRPESRRPLGWYRRGMLPSIPPAKTTQVQRFLHVNLNCADLALSGQIYTSLFGMREVMHTESTDGDGLAMGITEAVDSRVSFLYDHRGARRSPSLELVAWDRPRVVQKRYMLPNHVGMQSVAYTVGSLDAVRAGVSAFGLPTGCHSASPAHCSCGGTGDAGGAMLDGNLPEYFPLAQFNPFGDVLSG